MCCAILCVSGCVVPCRDGVVPYRVVSCGCVVVWCCACSDYYSSMFTSKPMPMSPWLPRSNSEGLVHFILEAHGCPRMSTDGGEKGYLRIVSTHIQTKVIYCCHVDREVAVGFSALGSNRPRWAWACGTRVFVRLSGGDATHIRRRQSHFSHGQATASPHGQLKAEAVRPTLRARR